MDALKFFSDCKSHTWLLQKIWKMEKYKEENKDDLTVHHIEVTSGNILVFFLPVFAELHLCLKHNWDCSVNVLQTSPFMGSPIVNVPTSLCASTVFVITQPCVGGVLILLHLHALIRHHYLQFPSVSGFLFRVNYLVAKSLCKVQENSS